MPSLVSAYQITKSFASKTLFQNISFAIESQERVGLIGPNGAGKSTLLNIIARNMKPDFGSVTFANNLVLGFLEQKPQMDLSLSIYQTLMSATSDEWDSENIQLAYELISKLELDRFPEGVEKLVSQLSGGWQKKVALARELMKRPNLLLLDEPTNHLDLPSILWLEEFLIKSRDIALLIVTHDRRFLQNTCNVIFDLNPQLPHGLLRTAGSYSSHLESKMILLDGQKRLEEKRRNTMLREKEWLARGPQARLTKQKARIDRAYDLIDEVKSLETKNAKKNLNLDFGNQEKSPKRLIEANCITKSFSEQTLFKDFSVVVRPQHRYGLIGTNGSGKSTLLKCLTGRLTPDTGNIFVNDDIEISYFEQGKDQINLEQSVLKIICPEGDYVHFQGNPVFARSYLSRFYFNAQQMDMPAKQLSGGELSRLILAKLMLKKAHVLIMDEPTNDLDVETLEALSECIEEFGGAVILVSHDRYFMDQNCDVIWALNSSNGEILTFADTFQWEDWQKNSKKIDAGRNTNDPTRSVSNSSTPSKKIGLSNKEKIEFEKIEQTIAAEELKLKNLQIELSKPSSHADFEKLTQLTQEIAGCEKNIEYLMTRWEHLSSKNI
jgi:ATP-binding cassette subfamily F protein uup